MTIVTSIDPTSETDLVVAEDGSIPADQVARLGLRPGAHVRVIESSPAVGDSASLAGSLPDFPDLDWTAFEQASNLARSDLSSK